METNKFSVKFFPNYRKVSKNGMVTIYGYVTKDRKKFEFSTHASLLKEMAELFWDDKQERINSGLHDDVNLEIEKAKKQLNNIKKRAELEDSSLSFQRIKSEFYQYKEGREELLGYLKYFEDEFVKKDTTKAEGTRRNYEKFYKHLKLFLRIKNRDRIRLRDCDLKFVTDFEQFLKTHLFGKMQKPLAKGTIAGDMKKLKTVFKRAMIEGLIKGQPYFGFSIERENKRCMRFLEDEEYRRLKRKDFDLGESAVKVLDIFLFSCYVGMSYVDAMSLRDSDFLLGKFGCGIAKRRTKGGEPFHFMMPEEALLIIRKYEKIPERCLSGFVLPRMSLNTINKQLKIIAEKASIRTRLSHHLARKFCNCALDFAGVGQDARNIALGWSIKTNDRFYLNLCEEKRLVRTKKLLDDYLVELIAEDNTGKEENMSGLNTHKN
jgi:integrase/recombinase XerD